MVSGDEETEYSVPGLYSDAATCAIVNFLEGAVIGGSLAAVISALPSVVKGKLGRAASAIVTRNNARVALFLGIFMAVHNTGIHMQRKKNSDIKRLIKLLSMVVSGSAVMLLPPRLRQFIVYLLFTRALEVLARQSRLNTKTSASELISSHESVALTMVSMSVITTTWFGWPHLVSKSYLHFLDNISNIKGEYFRKLGKVLLLKDVNEDPHLRYVVNKKKPCSAFHDDATLPCTPFIGNVFVRSLVTKTIPFYAKLYIIPFVLTTVRGKMSLRLVQTTAVRLWWSGLFLGVLDTLVGATICTISNQHVIPHMAIMPLAGAVSGLSLYIEQPSRRLELALYMFGQALQMVVNAYNYNGLWAPKNFDVVVCAASATVLANGFGLQQQLEEEEEGGNVPIVLRPTYNALLGKILDTECKRHSFRLSVPASITRFCSK
jgi:Ca2+/Na+ antiporter